jgi:hypothetical protein
MASGHERYAPSYPPKGRSNHHKQSQSSHCLKNFPVLTLCIYMPQYTYITLLDLATSNIYHDINAVDRDGP